MSTYNYLSNIEKSNQSLTTFQSNQTNSNSNDTNINNYNDVDLTFGCSLDCKKCDFHFNSSGIKQYVCKSTNNDGILNAIVFIIASLLILIIIVVIIFYLRNKKKEEAKISKKDQVQNLKKIEINNDEQENSIFSNSKLNESKTLISSKKNDNRLYSEGNNVLSNIENNLDNSSSVNSSYNDSKFKIKNKPTVNDSKLNKNDSLIKKSNLSNLESNKNENEKEKSFYKLPNNKEDNNIDTEKDSRKILLNENVDVQISKSYKSNITNNSNNQNDFNNSNNGNLNNTIISNKSQVLKGKILLGEISDKNHDDNRNNFNEKNNKFFRDSKSLGKSAVKFKPDKDKDNYNNDFNNNSDLEIHQNINNVINMYHSRNDFNMPNIKSQRRKNNSSEINEMKSDINHNNHSNNDGFANDYLNQILVEKSKNHFNSEMYKLKEKKSNEVLTNQIDGVKVFTNLDSKKVKAKITLNYDKNNIDLNNRSKLRFVKESIISNMN